MAGFRKDKTTAAQTAANVAGGVTGSLISAGVVDSVTSAAASVVEIFKALFAELGPVVDADNALFEAVENAGGGAKASAALPAAKSDDPGDTILPGGKFKGMSIADVHGLSEDDAKAKGHTYGSGATYIENYVATDKNTNQTTRDAAKAYLAKAA